MNSQADPLNLIIGGIGGQGNILLSRMIGRILTRKSYFLSIGETFGAAQRGGPVFSSMRVSKVRYYGPLIPQGKGNTILSLEPLETLRILNIFGNPDVVTITNIQPIYPVGVLSKRLEYPDLEKLKKYIQRLSRASWFLNATELAMELKSPIVANIVMLGALVGSKTTPISLEDSEREIKNSFSISKIDLNLEGLNMGFNAVRQKIKNG